MEDPVRPGQASRTAQHNALFRALERRLPQPLFDDPWAGRFLRGRYRLAAALPARAVARLIDRRWPGPRAAVCVRTRYFDDAIRQQCADGLDQLVILGAGFDSRAERLPALHRIRVFEVDHPATQALKREAMRAAGERAVYVPLDFRHGSLEAGLAAAGLAPGLRTLFLWEGVTNYLDDASVDATLRAVARLGSGLLFTYVDRALLDGSVEFEGGARSLAHVRGLGEPFTFGLRPAELAGYLRERGLALLEDLSLADAASLYYGPRRPPVSAYYHVVRARCRG
jgi:methyltransferase (TIGR00027 family)